MFSRSDLPNHLLANAGVHIASELIGDPLESTWFRLASKSSFEYSSDATEHVIRKCFLIRPALLARAFAGLTFVGNVIGELGLPSIDTIRDSSGRETYRYRAAHDFELRHTGILVEPLVAYQHFARRATFLINTDLWLDLALEESSAGSGSWLESRTGNEVLRQRFIGEQHLQVVEIRRDHLMRYLRDRQRALVVGHYADALVDPLNEEQHEAFVARQYEFQTNRPHRAKALLSNTIPIAGSSACWQGTTYQLHLWFSIRPPVLRRTRTWEEPPTFNVRTFVFPTHLGNVAPERF